MKKLILGLLMPALVLADSIIVGELNWKDVEKLWCIDPASHVAKAVGYLSVPVKRARCTAFLISKDLVMTNNHCVRNKIDAVGAEVSFDFKTSVPNKDRVYYQCSELVLSDALLDMAVLKCVGSPGSKYGHLSLEESDNTNLGQGVYVIHQNCDYFLKPGCSPTKKFSPGKVVRMGSEISHDADTLGGSSGSPLFSKWSNKVIGLHHAGSPHDGTGRGLENYAIPMHRIVKLLKDEGVL